MEHSPPFPASHESTGHDRTDITPEVALSEHELVLERFADTPMAYELNGTVHIASGSYQAVMLCKFLQNEALPASYLEVQFELAAERYGAHEDKEIESPVTQQQTTDEEIETTPDSASNEILIDRTSIENGSAVPPPPQPAKEAPVASRRKQAEVPTLSTKQTTPAPLPESTAHQDERIVESSVETSGTKLPSTTASGDTATHETAAASTKPAKSEPEPQPPTVRETLLSSDNPSSVELPPVETDDSEQPEEETFFEHEEPLAVVQSVEPTSELALLEPVDTPGPGHIDESVDENFEAPVPPTDAMDQFSEDYVEQAAEESEAASSEESFDSQLESELYDVVNLPEDNDSALTEIQVEDEDSTRLFEQSQPEIGGDAPQLDVAYMPQIEEVSNLLADLADSQEAPSDAANGLSHEQIDNPETFEEPPTTPQSTKLEQLYECLEAQVIAGEDQTEEVARLQPALKALLEEAGFDDSELLARLYLETYGPEGLLDTIAQQTSGSTSTTTGRHTHAKPTKIARFTTRLLIESTDTSLLSQRLAPFLAA